MFITQKNKDINSYKESKTSQEASKVPSALSTAATTPLAASLRENPLTVQLYNLEHIPSGTIERNDSSTTNNNNPNPNHALYPLDVDAISQLLGELSHDYLCMTALSTKIPTDKVGPLVAVFADALYKVSQSDSNMHLRSAESGAQDEEGKNTSIEISSNLRNTPARFLSVLLCIEIENHLRISANSSEKDSVGTVTPSSWQSCLIEDYDEEEVSERTSNSRIRNGNINNYGDFSRVGVEYQSQTPHNSYVCTSSFPSLSSVENNMLVAFGAVEGGAISPGGIIAITNSIGDASGNQVQPIAPPPLCLNGVFRGSSFTPLLLDAILNHIGVRDGIYERVKRGLDRGMSISQEEFLNRLKRRIVIQQSKKSQETNVNNNSGHRKTSSGQTSLIELLQQVSQHNISGVITAVMKEHALERVDDFTIQTDSIDRKNSVSTNNKQQIIEGVDVSVLYDELSNYETVLRCTSRVLLSAVNEALLPFLRSILEALCTPSFPPLPNSELYTETAACTTSKTPLVPLFVRLAMSDVVGFVGEIKREHLQLLALSNGTDKGKCTNKDTSSVDSNSEVRNKGTNVKDEGNKNDDESDSIEIQNNKCSVMCSIFLLRFLCPLIMKFPALPVSPESQTHSRSITPPQGPQISNTPGKPTPKKKTDWRPKAVHMHKQHYYDHHHVLMSMIAKYLQRVASGHHCFMFNLNCVIYDSSDDESDFGQQVEKTPPNVTTGVSKQKKSSDNISGNNSERSKSSDALKSVLTTPPSPRRKESSKRNSKDRTSTPGSPRSRALLETASAITRRAQKRQLFSNVKTAVHQTIMEELNPLIKETLTPILVRLFSALSNPYLEQEEINKIDNWAYISKFQYSRDGRLLSEVERNKLITDLPQRMNSPNAYPLNNNTNMKDEIIFINMVRLLDPVLPYIANGMLNTNISRRKLLAEPTNTNITKSTFINRHNTYDATPSLGSSILLPRLLKCCDYFHRRMKDVTVSGDNNNITISGNSKNSKKIKVPKTRSISPIPDEKKENKVRENVWKALVCLGNKGVEHPVITSHPHTFITFAGLVPAFKATLSSELPPKETSKSNNSQNINTVKLNNAEEIEAVIVINGELLLLSENLCFGGPAGKRHPVSISRSLSQETINFDEEREKDNKCGFDSVTSNKVRTVMLLEKMLPIEYKGVMLCRRHLVTHKRQPQKQSPSPESPPIVLAHPSCIHSNTDSHSKHNRDSNLCDRADGDIVAYIAAYVDYLTQVCDLKCRVVFIAAPCAASRSPHISQNSANASKSGTPSPRGGMKRFVRSPLAQPLDINNWVTGTQDLGNEIDYNFKYNENYVSDSATHTYFDGAWIRALFSREGGVIPQKVLDKIANIIIIERDEMNAAVIDETSAAPSYGLINKTTQIFSRIRKSTTQSLSVAADLNSSEITPTKSDLCQGPFSSHASSGRNSPFCGIVRNTAEVPLRCGCVPGTFPVDQYFRREKKIKKSTPRSSVNEIMEEEDIDYNSSDDITNTIISYFPKCSHCGLTVSAIPSDQLTGKANPKSNIINQSSEYTDKALYFNSIRDAYLVACGGLVRRIGDQCSSGNPDSDVMHPVKESIYRSLISTSLLGPGTMPLGLSPMEELNNIRRAAPNTHNEQPIPPLPMLEGSNSSNDITIITSPINSKEHLTHCLSRATLVDIVRTFSYMYSVPSPKFLHSTDRRLKMYDVASATGTKSVDLESSIGSFSCKFNVSSITSMYPSPPHGHDVLNLMRETETGHFHSDVASSSSYLTTPITEPRHNRNKFSDSLNMLSATCAPKKPTSPVTSSEPSFTRDENRRKSAPNIPNNRPVPFRRPFEAMPASEQRARTLCLWPPNITPTISPSKIERSSAFLQPQTQPLSPVHNSQSSVVAEVSEWFASVVSSNKQEGASNDNYWWWKSQNPVEDDLVELFVISTMNSGSFEMNARQSDEVLSIPNLIVTNVSNPNDMPKSVQYPLPSCTLFGFIDSNIQVPLMKSFEERLQMVLADNGISGAFDPQQQDNNNNNGEKSRTFAMFDLKCAPVRTIWRLILSDMTSRWNDYNARALSYFHYGIYTTVATDLIEKSKHHNNTETDPAQDRSKSNDSVKPVEFHNISLREFLFCSAVSLHCYCSSTPTLNIPTLFHNIKGSQLFLFYVTRWVTWLLLRNTGRQQQNIEMIVDGLNQMLSRSRLRVFVGDYETGNNNINNNKEDTEPNKKSEANNTEEQIVKEDPTESCLKESAPSTSPLKDEKQDYNYNNNNNNNMSLDLSDVTCATAPGCSIPSYRSIGDTQILNNVMQQTDNSSLPPVENGSFIIQTEVSVDSFEGYPCLRRNTLPGNEEEDLPPHRNYISKEQPSIQQSEIPLLLAPVKRHHSHDDVQGPSVGDTSRENSNNDLHSRQSCSSNVSFLGQTHRPDDQFFITSMFLSGAPLGYVLYLEGITGVK